MPPKDTKAPHRVPEGWMVQRSMVIMGADDGLERYILCFRFLPVGFLGKKQNVVTAFAHGSGDGEKWVQIACTAQGGDDVLHRRGPPRIWNWRKLSMLG